MGKAELRAAGWGGIDEDPGVFLGSRGGIRGEGDAVVVGFRCAAWGPVGGCADVLAYDVRFADPAALRVGEDDGDGVPGFFEALDEGEDVWA